MPIPCPCSNAASTEEPVPIQQLYFLRRKSLYEIPARSRGLMLPRALDHLLLTPTSPMAQPQTGAMFTHTFLASLLLKW